MASPFGKANSPFADMSGNGLRGFGSGLKDPFQQQAGQKSFGFGNISLSAVTNKESEPKSPFQQSKLFDDGSSTSQTQGGSSILCHASPSPFSFGIPSLSSVDNQEKQKNPFLQSTPLGGEILARGKGPTTEHCSNILGIASTSPISTTKASPFAFIRSEHEEKNPFQQSKAFGGEGFTLKNSPTTKGSIIFGHASTSAFTSGISSPFASISKDHESKNPFKRSPFLIGKSLAAGPSETVVGSSTQGNASFSFGKPSPFAISSNNVDKPELTNPFQTSTPDGNRSTWGQKEVGNSTIGGGSPFVVAPFGQPSCSQNPLTPFASALWRYISISRFFSTTVCSLRHPIGSGSQSTGPSPSFHPLREQWPGLGKTYTKPRTFDVSSIFPPSSYGTLPSAENAECMEEDTLVSLSATPSFENTSPEELRWQDYQAKQAVASQMPFKVTPPGSFNVPTNMCNGGAAPSKSQFFTPNPADPSTPICKFCNNGCSLTPSLAIPAAGSNSWSFCLSEGTPSTTPLNTLSKPPSPFSPALPFCGLQNQLQLARQSPLVTSSASLDFSSGVCSISTMSCPSQASSDVKAQSEKAAYLEWPQSSLQAPILSMPCPLLTITSSPSAGSVNPNISAPAAPENFNAVIYKFSNAESGSSAQHGISSLPDAGKYSQPRTISLLTSKQVFQKTVIRMQSRRQGSLKKDGPRVSFLNDVSDPEDSGNWDTQYVARKNPKEFLLRAPWLNNSATQIGASKDVSIKSM